MIVGIRPRAWNIPLAAILLGSLLVCAAPRTGAAQATPGWPSFGGNAQHTGQSGAAAQSLEVIHWSTPVDLAQPSGTILIHYGSPLVTPANTVIIPVKTGALGGYRVDARTARDGALIWSATTDYVLPPHNWTPSYSPALGPDNRLYFPGAGGTIYYRDNVDDGVPGASGQLAFFGLAAYHANPASFNATVFVNTPITVDSAGTIYFGFRTSAGAPLGLQSGIARIDASGAGSWVSAAAIAGDATVTQVPHQAAPALSNAEGTLYVIVAGAAGTANAYLVGLDPVTLTPKEVSAGAPVRTPLKDPRSGATSNAWVTDDSSASPMVGPDGDVYYGVLGNPFNGSRGWLLHFSGDLTRTKAPGAFGWDSTAAIVPASAVPTYAGISSYLIFSKYNNYAGAGTGDWGDGVNKIAVLDPSATQVEPHTSSSGLLVMKEILTVAGPTPDPEFRSSFPNAVREWCINAVAVDPVTKSLMVNSEDGKLYRWDLTTNTLSQAVTLSSGVGEAYTPTVIGPDGTVYAINQAILDAVGQRPAIAINDAGVAESNGGTTTAIFTVSLSFASKESVAVNYATADGLALAGGDYTAASGTLVFAPGETAKTIGVLVKGDASNEIDETFSVNLSQPVNATIARGQGRGTILNDDPLPALSISDASITEGNSGTTNAVFTVTLAPVSGRTVSVSYATADGSASVAGDDYLGASGVLTFAPGQTTKTIAVVVKGDTVSETVETFFVNLSDPVNATLGRSQGVGTILNDDVLPKLSIKDVSVVEGNGGTTAAIFTVTLTPASGQVVTVTYATADGTAKAAGNDYLPQSGALTFAPGETFKTITVAVIGDTVKEKSETFSVNLGVATNALIQRARGRATIVNDDKH